MPGSYSWAQQFAIGTALPVDKRLNFGAFNFGLQEEIHDGNQTTGDQDFYEERINKERRRVGGSIEYEPNREELTELLTWAIGAPTGTTFALANSLPTRYAATDLVDKVPTFTLVAVDTLSFMGRSGGGLMVETDLVGVDQMPTVGLAGSFPAIAIPLTSAPMLFASLTLTFAGGTHLIDDFRLDIKRNIDRERFYNSLTLTDINPKKRMVEFAARMPWKTAYAIYVSGAKTAAATIVATDGTATITITLPAVALPRIPVTTTPDTEIQYSFKAQCFAQAGVKPVTIVYDADGP